MRTTIRLDDDLLRRAKARAAETGRSLNDVIAEAVRAALMPKAAGAVHRPRLPILKGGTLLPGVDLDDSAALLDRMEDVSGYPGVSTSMARPAAKVAEPKPKPKRGGGT
jgi:Ribbon-helix-helix protein, copG family